MKTIKTYSSYATIKNILIKADFVPVKHQAVNINGRRHGFTGFFQHQDTKTIIYVSTDTMPTLHGPVMYRIAKDITDYKGGANNFAWTDEELINGAARLVKWTSANF